MHVVSGAKLQAGLYATLAADAALVALLPAGVGGIAAVASPDLVPPFVLIAETRTRPAGTQSLAGSEVAAVIEVYSRVPGGREAREIAAAAAEAVTALEIEGQAIAYARVRENATRQEADGVTYVARLAVEAVCCDEGEDI